MPGHREAQATRREQILEAAYEVALRRGIDGLTVRAVAVRARLSHSLVLFHFKRKDQLGLALLPEPARTAAGAVPAGAAPAGGRASSPAAAAGVLDSRGP
jgi:DNA-binding transcriptional regulator YbjK